MTVWLVDRGTALAARRGQCSNQFGNTPVNKMGQHLRVADQRGHHRGEAAEYKEDQEDLGNRCTDRS